LNGIIIKFTITHSHCKEFKRLKVLLLLINIFRTIIYTRLSLTCAICWFDKIVNFIHNVYLSSWLWITLAVLAMCKWRGII